MWEKIIRCESDKDVLNRRGQRKCKKLERNRELSKLECGYHFLVLKKKSFMKQWNSLFFKFFKTFLKSISILFIL
jgi:hypothetical protein